MTEPTQPVPAEAKKVLQSFLDAAGRNDLDFMRTCVTRSTLESGQLKSNTSEGMSFVMDEGHMEGDIAVIPIRGYPTGAPQEGPPVMELPCMIVQEDGAWKFDVGASVERMLGGLGGAMDAMVGVMAKAVEGIGKAMAEGLSQALGGELSQAETQEPDWSQASPVPWGDERLGLPEMELLPKTQEALTRAVGSPVEVQAALQDLLRQAGSDERDVLTNWLDDQLFAGWEAMFARVAAAVPLKDRLRAIRIESATMPRNRMLALDGSDLVYRMCLPSNEGFFSDGEIEELLPGVLAGLPDPMDTATIGYRTLPTDDEHPPVELYEHQTAPRYMRRISDLLGRPIALDVNWDDVRETSAGLSLSRWGLNRVCGGIALALRTPERGEKLKADLKRIRLRLGVDVTETAVRYEDGTLELALNFFEGDKPGCYEREIAQVLGDALG